MRHGDLDERFGKVGDGGERSESADRLRLDTEAGIAVRGGFLVFRYGDDGLTPEVRPNIEVLEAIRERVARRITFSATSGGLAPRTAASFIPIRSPGPRQYEGGQTPQ